MEMFDRKYNILVHNTKRDGTGEVCVNIESPDLDYVDMFTHEGLQCNVLSDNRNYKKIKHYCVQIANAIKEIEKLNIRTI